jgi:hypothetical protein
LAQIVHLLSEVDESTLTRRTDRSFPVVSAA